LGHRPGGNNGVSVPNLDDVLIQNSPYKNMTSLKRRLINEKRLEYKCALCGNIGTWNGKELVL